MKKFLIVLILIIVGFAGYFGKDFVQRKLSPVQPWYAVHLSNGQVYFGHISSLSSYTITVSDTYYLESVSGTQTSQSGSFMLQQESKPTYKLVRRGDDATLLSDHTLFINRAAVLFWEKLTDASDIVRLITKGN